MIGFASARVLRGLLALAVLVLSASLLRAQVDTGSITGVITDPSGAIVGGAKVTLTNEGTGTTLSTTTGSNGVFDFSPVRIGNYKLEVVSTGFKTAIRTHVVVEVSARVAQDFQLQTGAVNETVEVTTTAPVLQSQDASVGQVVDQRNVNNLPLNGRNFTFLAQLAAGVNSPQADTRGNAASGALPPTETDRRKTTTCSTESTTTPTPSTFSNGTNFVVLPPVDAIQEFKVETSGFSAEYGRSGAAVLNATIKSGTNQFHGAAWEFFRNDKLDAADYFEDANRIPKGELRQNQFGAMIGGPIIKNKFFFFADYEGLRRLQGTVLQGSVPTAAERASGYTDMSDLITLQASSAALTDALGRTMPYGTILDPATTRKIVANTVDPVSGLTPTVSGYTRDPFGTCAASTVTFSLASCGLNQLPAGRLDPNAIALMNLYPSPTNGSLVSNYANSPKLNEHSNAFDTRVDLNVNDKNQLFYRFSYKDDPQFIPGIFGGIADGGGFQQGSQTALAQQSALPTPMCSHRAWSTWLVQDSTTCTRLAFRLSQSNSRTSRRTFGIQGIPQIQENGGLPAFGINGLSTLGSNAFLPSDEVSSTFQLTDDLTKIYGKHTFKMGFEWQHVKFSTLQPPWSRGEFDYNGNFTDIPSGVPSADKGNTGRAAFLLTPVAAQNGGTVDFVGGSTNIYASNISLTDNGKNYYGAYFNDDWKLTPRLTINLGLRWDFFGLVFEHHGAQANFAPSGAPTGSPLYILPGGTNAASFSQAALRICSRPTVSGLPSPTNMARA